MLAGTEVWCGLYAFALRRRVGYEDVGSRNLGIEGEEVFVELGCSFAWTSSLQSHYFGGCYRGIGAGVREGIRKSWCLLIKHICIKKSNKHVTVLESSKAHSMTRLARFVPPRRRSCLNSRQCHCMQITSHFRLSTCPSSVARYSSRERMEPSSKALHVIAIWTVHSLNYRRSKKIIRMMLAMLTNTPLSSGHFTTTTSS